MFFNLEIDGAKLRLLRGQLHEHAYAAMAIQIQLCEEKKIFLVCVQHFLDLETKFIKDLDCEHQ